MFSPSHSTLLRQSISETTSTAMAQGQLTYQGVATNLNTVLPAANITGVNITVNIAAQPLVKTAQTQEPWNFTVSNTDPGRVTISTTFESSPGAGYQSETGIVPTFTIAGVAAVGAQVMLTLLSPTSSSTIPANASANGEISTTESAPGTEIPAATATESSTTMRATPSPSNGTTVHSNASKTHSTGELAGAAVGCLIAGLLIASLLAFFFLKRRRNNRRPQHDSQREMLGGHSKSESFRNTTGPVAAWQRHLPQPESDQTISRLVNRTLDDIELFVENYYADRPTIQTTGSAATDMSPLNSPYLGRPLPDIVYTSNVPMVLFKHCITYYLLQKIDPAQNDSSSLLPREFVVPSRGELATKNG